MRAEDVIRKEKALHEAEIVRLNEVIQSAQNTLQEAMTRRFEAEAYVRALSFTLASPETPANIYEADTEPVTEAADVRA